jgi:hypothetical protein
LTTRKVKQVCPAIGQHFLRGFPCVYIPSLCFSGHRSGFEFLRLGQSTFSSGCLSKGTALGMLTSQYPSLTAH